MKKGTSKMLNVLLWLSILLNIVDIILHVATNQAEALRIIGNIVIIVVSSVALTSRQPKLVLAIGLLFYLILNGIFIVISGIGNAGIVLISLTIALALVSLFLQKRK